MPTSVIMPALELAQETGKILSWLKAPGDTVTKGEPLVEIETDKVAVEIEAPASGVLREVTARVGDVVPVGRTIASISSGAASARACGVPWRRNSTRVTSLTFASVHCAERMVATSSWKGVSKCSAQRASG